MRKWRLVLPASQGLTAAGLMGWEHYNAGVIASMGMAWDTGAPVWPYQTPEVVLAILNAPAYLLSTPINNLLGFQMVGQRNPILLMAVILLWFCVGKVIDDGLFRYRFFRESRLWVLFFVTLSTLCLYEGIRVTTDGVLWWLRYGDLSLSKLLVFARITSFAPWCTAMALVLSRAALIMLRPDSRLR